MEFPTCWGGFLAILALTWRPVDPQQLQQADRPQFLNSPLNYTATLGSDVRLLCEYKNLGGIPILWRRGYDVITAGESLISMDRRLILASNKHQSSLTIQGVLESDSGEYTCQFTAQEGVKSLIHTLTILVPATVALIPGGPLLTVQEGETVRLQCLATGNPIPTLRWSRKTGALPPGITDTGSSLTIPRIRRDQAGEFICQGSNGVGEPDAQKLQIVVQYPPSEVSIQSENLPGGQRRLDCQARGNPAPEMAWYLGPTKLPGSFKEAVSTETSKISLFLQRSDDSTFGNYSCEAHNQLGSVRSYIEVHGRPGAPTFHNAAVGRSAAVATNSDDSYTLYWSTASNYPLLEYRILYKKEQETDWRTEAVLETSSSLYSPSQEEFSCSWHLKDLEESALYYFIVQAKNVYGWGEPSSIHTHRLIPGTPSGPALWPGQNRFYSSSSPPLACLNFPRFLFLISLLYVQPMFWDN